MSDTRNKFVKNFGWITMSGHIVSQSFHPSHVAT